jgi:1,4-dihydroxy-2-naphthoate octaprenyltransferase
MGFRWFAPLLLVALFIGILSVAASQYLHQPTFRVKVLLFAVGPVGLIGAVLLCVCWRELLKNSGANR